MGKPVEMVYRNHVMAFKPRQRYTITMKLDDMTILKSSRRGSEITSSYLDDLVALLTHRSIKVGEPSITQHKQGYRLEFPDAGSKPHALPLRNSKPGDRPGGPIATIELSA